MSLREEIEKSLLYWDTGLDERALYYQSKDIIRIFEKRVDCLIQECKDNPIYKNPELYNQSSGSFARGKKVGVELVKEMFK